MDMSETKRTPPFHLVDDSQSPLNEAQQRAAGSGDPRTDNSADNLPLPFGGPSDNLHPITQPRGDVTKAYPEVGAPSRPVDQSEEAMRSENTEREYQGDTGRSQDEELPGRMQDRTSVRPKDVGPDVERGFGSDRHGDKFSDSEIDERERDDNDEEAA
jgi:hypothetical protein